LFFFRFLFPFFILFFISCQFPSGNKESSPYVLDNIDAKKYNRKTWDHWIDEDKNCLNTRAEILKKRSIGEVNLSKKGCSVVSGLWEDYYYPEKHQLAKDVDIDHLVPLKNAHDSGGFAWSENQKREFANDEENLVITNRKYNRQKGSQGIDTWLPVDKVYACKYIKDWMKIKNKYGLKISESEQKSYDLLIKSCH
jgi:hypothetical protein